MEWHSLNNFDMRGSRKFCQRRSNFDDVFFCLVDERRDDQMPKKVGHWPTSETPFDDDGPTLNAGSGSFLIFQGIWTRIDNKP